MKPKNIWCVGRNYKEHAKELGNEVPSEPLIFLKSPSCVIENKLITLPKNMGRIDFELEIALQFNENLEFHFCALALDLTARDIQSQLKEKSAPWTLAKSFINACPMSKFVFVDDLNQILSLDLILKQNGVIKQKSKAKNMIFNFNFLKKYLLKYFPVEAGDLVLTGTPAGVGPIAPGDHLEGQLGDLILTEWHFNA